MAIFTARSGIRVRSIGWPRQTEDGKAWRILCVRTDTQGFHGDLRLDRLVPVSKRAVRIAKRYSP